VLIFLHAFTSNKVKAMFGGGDPLLLLSECFITNQVREVIASN
jgi:hypothetical protein